MPICIKFFPKVKIELNNLRTRRSCPLLHPGLAREVDIISFSRRAGESGVANRQEVGGCSSYYLTASAFAALSTSSLLTQMNDPNFPPTAVASIARMLM